jgi:Zn finger protein HypA/HybF involved in hydrogenase expression
MAPVKVTVKCNECGRVWKVSANAATLECRKCGGCDIEVKEP